LTLNEGSFIKAAFWLGSSVIFFGVGAKSDGFFLPAIEVRDGGGGVVATGFWRSQVTALSSEEEEGSWSEVFGSAPLCGCSPLLRRRARSEKVVKK
jgi:hypothetical protein